MKAPDILKFNFINEEGKKVKEVKQDRVIPANLVAIQTYVDTTTPYRDTVLEFIIEVKP